MDKDQGTNRITVNEAFVKKVLPSIAYEYTIFLVVSLPERVRACIIDLATNFGIVNNKLSSTIYSHYFIINNIICLYLVYSMTKLYISNITSLFNYLIDLCYVLQLLPFQKQ